MTLLKTFGFIVLVLITFRSKSQVSDDIARWFERSFSDIELFRESFSLDLTYNHLIGETNGVTQKISSNGLNFGVMFNRDLFKNKDAKFLLGYGIRYSINVFRNNGALTVDDTLGTSQLGVYDGALSRSSYNFSHRFIELPVELRLRHYGNEITRYTLGFVVGFRTRMFEQARIGTSPFFQMHYPDANFIRYGLFVRAGFKRIGLYAGYYINPIFKNPNSAKLNIFNVGLNFAL
jgi:hypothetical protein